MGYQGYNPNNQGSPQWDSQPPATSYSSPDGQYPSYGGQMGYQQSPGYQPAQQPYPTPGAYTPQVQGMYPQQTPYGVYPGMSMSQVDPDRGKAIAGLVLGIVALVIWLIPFVGALTSIVLSILGIVFSSQGRRSVTAGGMANAGLVLSIIAVILVPVLLLCSLGTVLLI